MSELFDDDPRDSPPRGTSGRTRALIITAVALALLLFLLTTFASIWTDHLWFDQLGYGSVFNRLFWVRTGLFLGFGLVMGGTVAATIILAYRHRPLVHPTTGDNGLERYRDAVTPIRTWLLVGVSVIAGVFAGASGAGKWRTYLLWRNGGAFGTKDPYFGKDIGFYVFDLPWWHLVVNFVMAATVVALLLSLLVNYLYGGIRLQSRHDRVSGSAQVQLSTLIAIFVLAKAIDYWLDRYDLVHGDGPKMTGIGYTDDHAVLPAKAILAGIAIICAVLFLVNVWRRTWLLPGVGAALLVVSAILLGLIWPAIVQGFQVRPSPDKETPYLAKNITATRQAYAIDDATVSVQNYNAQPNTAAATAPLASDLDKQVASAPIVDPQLVHDLFQNSQQVRGYYGVAQPLDVDRYTIDGKDRALVLGVRELDQSGIDPKDRTWTNLHTTYTHGYGVIAAYANQRDKTDRTESADIQWAQGYQANQDDVVAATGGQVEQRVYFGEKSSAYAVVGRPKGASPVELDLGNGQQDDSHTTYDGSGGVPIGSTFRRLLYGIKFGSSSFLLSGRMNDNSEILYNRTPRERVEKVAPWLTLDDDAYPVVVDGRIQWVIDGYTTTDRYPGAEKDSFKEMTDDVLQQDTGLRTLPTDQINYMRNAVKATVDAYDGTVHLYAWDESDPILKAWSKVFPGTVLPRSAIPADLLPHLRYPEDLFKVQRYQLAKYHVTDARAFQQGSDWWQVPLDPNSSVDHLMAPYRMFLDQPGGDEEVWSLSTTFTPTKRTNLSAVMTVNSDATSPDYGRIQVLERPDQVTQGPEQVVQDLKNDAAISAALQPYRTGSLLSYGNLLTIPTSTHGLIYLMPVYARQATSSPYPVLAYVLVKYGNHMGYGKTLQEAITKALSTTSTPTPPPSPSTPPSPSSSPSPTPSTSSPSTGGSREAQARRLLADAQSLFNQAEAAGKQGDFAKREELLKQAEAKVTEAVALLG